MNSHPQRLSLCGLIIFALAGSLPVMPAAHAQETKKAATDPIPTKVMGALKAKFPNAEIHRWTREKDGDLEVYDIEFKQAGRKFEADILADGTFQNWEQEFMVKDLPAAVTQAVDKRYPKATVKEVMAVTAVKEGKDLPEGYEIVLKTAAGKGVEVSVAPGGEILEDSGQEK